HHRALTEWALSNLPDVCYSNILDIGCGGGMLISLLAERFPNASIHGIDISDESVRLTKETNNDLVKKGKCTVTKNSVSDLPFENDSFDLVTAFETYFFWPDIFADIKEATRVVSPGGYVLIVSEAYPHPDFDEQNAKYTKLYGLKLLKNEELKELIGKCGFNVKVIEIEERNWVAFIGKRV
ncbi:MAG: methyltransferase domain-containing protein, partial [Candidatus Methanomethylophilaceae archaeon]